jgi:hypothetical protein
VTAGGVSLSFRLRPCRSSRLGACQFRVGSIVCLDRPTILRRRSGSTTRPDQSLRPRRRNRHPRSRHRLLALETKPSVMYSGPPARRSATKSCRWPGRAPSIGRRSWSSSARRRWCRCRSCGCRWRWRRRCARHLWTCLTRSRRARRPGPPAWVAQISLPFGWGEAARWRPHRAASQTASSNGALAVTLTASGSVSKPRVANSHPSSLCRQSSCPVERAKPRA